MEEVVSVIVCCYNGSNHLENCFSCLLNQSYSRLEVLFVDDGSTDDSYEKSLSYSSLFSGMGGRLLCFSQENKGVGAAASLALSHASGEYVCCYDIDDILYDDSIKEMVSFLDSNPSYDIVRTNGFKEDGKGRKSLFVLSETEKQQTDLFEDILLGRINNWAGSYMIRSSALWEVYPSHTINESRYGQNLQLLLSVSYGRKAGFIDKPLMEYRFNPDSFTNKDKDYHNRLEKLLGFKSIRLSILDHLELDRNYYILLDIEYLTMMMDLDLQYNKSDRFIFHYDCLKTLHQPSYIYTYYYHKFKGNNMICLFYRLKSYFSRSR